MPIKTVKVEKLNRHIKESFKLIEKIEKLNGFQFDLTIHFNLSYKHLGRVFKGNNKLILINPLNCRNTGLRGHPDDESMFYVIMHEFSHLLDYRLKLGQHYYLKYPFKKNRLFVNYNSEENLEEEIAELLSIYFVNPYIIKLLDNEKWEWLNSIIKSPTPCTKNRFLKYYGQWTNDIQTEFQKENNIIVDLSKKTVIVNQ